MSKFLKGICVLLILVCIPFPVQGAEVRFKPVELKDLGEFKVTAYCSCEKCCGKYASNRPNGKVIGACGQELIPHYSIAVDPKVIPYGTEVIINGQIYKAMDCGGSIKNKRIDVYFSDHNEALKFGVQTADIFIK